MRATDPAGNIEDPPATTTWTVVEPPDTTAPTVTIVDRTVDDDPTPPPRSRSSSTSRRPPSVRSTRRLRPVRQPAEYTGLALGTHTFAVRATDAAGNVGDGELRLDRRGAAGHDSARRHDHQRTAADDECDERHVRVHRQRAGDHRDARSTVGRSPPAAARSPTPALALGPHTFQVRATDAAGNVGTATWSWTIVDTTAPNTTITSGPASPTTATSATFSFAANEAGARFECRLDSTADSAFSACTSPRTYSGLAVGAHTFSVRAIDPSGNVDASPASFGWTIQPPPDTTPPQTTITSGPPAQTLSTSAAFVFEANEPSSTFQCRLDGGAWLACTSPRSYVNVPVGSHPFEVRATDFAGNIDATPAPHPWTVEPPPPPPPPGRPARSPR